MSPHDILKYFESRQEAILRMTHQIVEIESPSFDVSRSRMVADWIAEKVDKIPLGISVERVAADNVGDHLAIRAFPDESKKQLLLLGHTDTVHPVGTRLKNATRIEGERFYGCGVFDMKANIVLMLETLRYFSENSVVPPRPITILLSCDEEAGSKTGKSLVETEAARSEACLVCEPSAMGKVKTGRKGTGMFTIAAHGVPSHAGLEPERGASAIVELAHQILKLQTLNNAELGTTVNVCTIEGGTASNVIPEHAECSVDVRFSRIDEAARIENEIASLAPVNERVSLEISGGVNRPPMERTDAVAALYEMARDLAASFNYELGETQVGGASDGNFVAAMGVPVLDGLGVAGDGAHTLDEYILIDDIPKRATLLALLMQSV
ncbi:MAG: M20 family metallopeptidase [Pyrinomonadaceae bacterium]